MNDRCGKLASASISSGLVELALPLPVAAVVDGVSFGEPLIPPILAMNEPTGTSVVRINV